jgi:acyl-CoA thioesterase FadM
MNFCYARLVEAGTRISHNRAAGHMRHGALLCEGTIRIGWVDAQTPAAARIPPIILEA